MNIRAFMRILYTLFYFLMEFYGESHILCQELRNSASASEVLGECTVMMADTFYCTACALLCIHTYILAYIHSYIIHTYICTYIHTHIHTHTHIPWIHNCVVKTVGRGTSHKYAKFTNSQCTVPQTFYKNIVINNNLHLKIHLHSKSSVYIAIFLRLL